jgi:hypothetical protein
VRVSLRCKSKACHRLSATDWPNKPLLYITSIKKKKKKRKVTSVSLSLLVRGFRRRCEDGGWKEEVARKRLKGAVWIAIVDVEREGTRNVRSALLSVVSSRG